MKSSRNPKDIAAVTLGKTPLQLIPPIAMTMMAEVLDGGADKYGPWNWRGAPIELMTYVGAIMRHTNAIASGEDIDPESGLPHVAHIAATAAIVMDATHVGALKDDRP